MHTDTVRADKVVTIPARKTRRVRLDIDEAKADKLRAVAKAKGRTQAELVELFIDSLDNTDKG
jgi:fructose-1,6-bisphosphatase/sedoheptulose 1,7-bisphosphatase-like protein